MSSTIYDPFVVTNLPRLSPKVDISTLCLTSQITDSNASSFDISISGSYLATFVTRPSPKMIWSYALSPETFVTAMDSYDFEGSHNSSNVEKKIFALGISERKVNKLKFVSYGLEDLDNSIAEDENQSSSISVVNEEDKTVEAENIKQVKDKVITTDYPIKGLEFSNDSKYVYALFDNGSMEVFQFTTDDEPAKPILSFDSDSPSNKTNDIIYHQFIKPEQLKINSRVDKIDYILLTAETTKNVKSLIVRLFAISAKEVVEISSSTIDVNDISKTQLTYDISGKLVALENNNGNLTLRTFEVPFLKNEHAIKIGGVFKHEPKDAPSSIICAATNRVLVTKGSTVALIDIQYESLLSSLDLYSRSKNSKTDNVKPARNATLIAVPNVAGNTLKSKKTFALLILKNTKENFSQIQHVSIDVGLGKLRDALISIPNEEEDINEEKFVSFPSYFTQNDISGDDTYLSKEVENLNSKMSMKHQELNKVYQQLSDLKEKGKLLSLEQHLIAYLKNRDFTDVFDNDDFKVYEYEKDRFVDPKFFEMVTLLLFNYNSRLDSISLDEYTEDEVPERGLTYVLTHPLFPTQYAHGLLKVLQNFPRLQRQCIVTCVNIPCGDLVLELSVTENDEIFKDIINRLTEEFSHEEITSATVKIMKQKSNKHNDFIFDLDKIINKIIKLNFGYEVLNSFIDSNGLVLSLHYANDANQLNKLIMQTQSKVDTLIEDTQLTLVNQLLLNVEKSKTSGSRKSKSGKKKKNKNKKSEIVDPQELEVGISKLDMILKIGDGENNKRNTTTSLSSYTVDRLVI
ncbi:hypothetical protein CANINC_003041 [Pichia inconspicua]|uniref:U3 small nucleolar RNA-associated protein 8 n=1 Tax=Pichia inconspicua TaxID=52247 RepID=A0A4T0WZM8_9ASCO|nr:hypothetical protein CANINC_003041 [[Candida] inconspicua]